MYQGAFSGVEVDQNSSFHQGASDRVIVTAKKNRILAAFTNQISASESTRLTLLRTQKPLTDVVTFFYTSEKKMNNFPFNFDGG